MVLYEVFSHPVKKRYRTSIFSKASLVQLIAIVLTSVSPFLIAYFTGGFWIKDKMYLEQPRVNFQYRFIMLLESAIDGTYLASSFDSVNQIYSNEFRPSIRLVNEIDTNGDGFTDQLDLSIQVSGINPTTNTIRSVKLLLLFNVALSTYSKINFESIAYLESLNLLNSNEIKLSGELDFFQQIKFQDKVTYDNYDYQMLDQNNLDLDELNVAEIVRKYNSRQYGTRLQTDFVSWGSGNADGFSMNARIRYTPFVIQYVPAFWEQFKWGWIQYLAVLIPFVWVFKTAKIFIYENQLVPTISVSPQMKVKST